MSHVLTRKDGLGWRGSPIYFPANLLLFTLEALGLQQTALGFLGQVSKGGVSLPFCPAFDLERVLSTQKATAAP